MFLSMKIFVLGFNYRPEAESNFEKCPLLRTQILIWVRHQLKFSFESSRGSQKLRPLAPLVPPRKRLALEVCGSGHDEPVLPTRPVKAVRCGELLAQALAAFAP